MKDKKVVFMGTPDFAVPVLERLINLGEVVLVVTQPDKEVGRKKVITKSPVKELAEEHNIEVFQPTKIREDYQKIEELKPDLIVTCAYGQILPPELLDVPKYGAINVHASLLPKYRGAAPIQWALLNGDDETGITLMYMDAAMDTGDMIAKKSCQILKSDNVGSLHDKLSKLGALLVEENWELIFSGEVVRIKQNDDEASYAPMIKRSDERLDFNQNGECLLNQIRALNPWPLANMILDDEEIKVIEAHFEKNVNVCPGGIREASNKKMGIDVADGTIYLDVIKPFGKKAMDIQSYLNGNSRDDLIGKRIG